MLGVHMQNLKIRGWDYNIPLMSSPKKDTTVYKYAWILWRFTVLSFWGFLQLYNPTKTYNRTIYNLPFCHLHPLLPRLLTVEVGCFQQGPEIRFWSLPGRDISPGQSWKNGRSLSHSGDLKSAGEVLINVNSIVPRPITLFLWNITGYFWTIILNYIYVLHRSTIYRWLQYIVILSESTSTPYEFQILAA